MAAGNSLGLSTILGDTGVIENTGLKRHVERLKSSAVVAQNPLTTHPPVYFPHGVILGWFPPSLRWFGEHPFNQVMSQREFWLTLLRA